MRRLAAALSLIALTHSIVLGTGALCERPDVEADAGAPMSGMDMGPSAHQVTGTQGFTDSTGLASNARHHDRHHDGAHCPLMAGCAAAAVTVASVAVSLETRPAVVKSDAPGTRPRSESPAPETPPPKD